MSRTYFEYFYRYLFLYFETSLTKQTKIGSNKNK